MSKLAQPIEEKNMQPLYEITHLVQRYNERTVLTIDTLLLEQGITYGLLGPNGAGKTTLMKCLAFLESFTKGEIIFQGEQVTAANMAKFRAKVVWVPQWPILFSGSLQYNIEYPMRLKKMPKAVCQIRAKELMEAVELLHLAKSPAQHLSGGEAQRASIARALATGAEVILFDEPTANVDYSAKAGLIELMKNLQKNRGLSVIITTHDQTLVTALCERTITLIDGKVVDGH